MSYRLLHAETPSLTRQIRVCRFLAVLLTIPLLFWVTGCDLQTETMPIKASESPESTRSPESNDDLIREGPIIDAPIIDAPNNEDPINEDPVQEPDSKQQTDQDPGVVQQAKDLLGKAKSTGTATVQGAGKWVQEKFNDVADDTGKTASDSMKWANDTFESLKKQGLTTADSTSEWLSQDWNNLDSWQYKVLSIGPMNDQELTERLNELGKQGWECFHTEEGPSTRMFFKKPSESYLRHLPFKDVIKLAPLLKQ